MRIIAGEYGGRVIAAPKGMGTRPTTDRVRESLMSAVASQLGGFEGVRVLDAFAGSGALGIECLSRGAAFAQFCDKAPTVTALVAKNLQALGVPRERFRVLTCDVLARPPHAAPPFDLVMLDPPYATPAADIAHLLDALHTAGSLADDALITYEHARGADIPPLASAAGFALDAVASKTYGDISIDFFRKRTV